MLSLPKTVYILFETDPPKPAWMDIGDVGPLALIWPSEYSARRWGKEREETEAIVEHAPSDLLVEDLQEAGFAGFAYNLAPHENGPGPDKLMLFWKPGMLANAAKSGKGTGAGN